MAPEKLAARDLIDVSNRFELTRFALRSQLDQYNQGGVKGRDAFRRAMNLSEAAATERLQERPADSALDCERLGLIPADVVSSFAVRQHQFPGILFRPRMSGSWWPDVVRSFGVTGTTEHHAVLAAESFIAARPEVFVANRPLGGDDLDIATALASSLASVICRPTTRSVECLDLLSLLAPYTLPTVLEIAESHPFGPKLVRALDRALRNDRTNLKFRDMLHQFLRNPGGIDRNRVLSRRRYWIRAVRRVLWFDAQRQMPVKSKRWATEQLVIAVRRERSYAWATEGDRRYAFWVLAEFTIDNEALWTDIVGEFGQDPAIQELAAPAEEGRAWLRQITSHRDLHSRRPVGGWSTTPGIAHIFQRHVEHDRAAAFRGLTRDRRRRAMSLLEEALLSPCDVRKRRAIDTLVAAGPAATEGAATVVNHLVHDLIGTDATPVYLLERTMHLLGKLPSRESITTLETVLRPTTNLPLTVVREAVWAAGGLCQRFPDDSHGLLAWLLPLVERANDAAVTTFAAHSLVAAGKHPTSLSADRRLQVATTAGLDIVTWAGEPVA